MDEEIKSTRKEPKIRKSWPKDFSPETKIETPKPLKKSRSSEKQALKKVLDNLNSLEDLDDLGIEF